MYTRREIKKQRSRCWSNQFITNLNKGDGKRGGRTLLRIVVMGKRRQAMLLVLKVNEESFLSEEVRRRKKKEIEKKNHVRDDFH